jgi:hypothetical protein
MNGDFNLTPSAFTEFLETGIQPDINYDEFKAAQSEIDRIFDMQRDYFDVQTLETELTYLSDENQLKEVIIGIIRRYSSSLDRDGRTGNYKDIDIVWTKARGILESYLFRMDLRNDTLSDFRKTAISSIEEINNPYAREVLVADLSSDNGHIIQFLRDEYKLFKPADTETEEVAVFKEQITPEEEFEIDNFVEENMPKLFNGRTRVGKFLKRYFSLISRFQELNLDQEEEDSLESWYNNADINLGGRLSVFEPKDIATIKEIENILRLAIQKLEEMFVEKYTDEYDNDREKFSIKYIHFTELVMSRLIKKFEDAFAETGISNGIAVEMLKSIFSTPATYFNLTFPDAPIRHLVDNMYNVLIRSNNQ